MFHEDTVLQPETRALLNVIGPHLCGEGFFLVGGTALAIQIGHRQSIDLDFFTRRPFDNETTLESLAALEGLGPIEAVNRADNTLHLNIDEVKVDILRYRYELLETLVEAGNYQMLALPDIAAMKLSAITNRGSKKDFFDLYFLLGQYTLQDLLEFYRQKFPGHDVFSVARSLVYFDDAEDEPDPLILRGTDLNWETVKNRAEEAVNNL